jgi:general secretion pathway protein E
LSIAATISGARAVETARRECVRAGDRTGQNALVECLESLESCEPHPEFVARIPIAYARQHGVLGLAGDDRRMKLAVKDAEDVGTMQVVARYLRRTVWPVLVPPDELSRAINAAYQQRTGLAHTLIEKLDGQAVNDVVRQMEDSSDLLDVGGHAPVVKLVNLILFEAVQARASDVHIQPYEDNVVVRLRIDGVLYDAFELPKAVQDEVIGRVKVMGHMDIADRRLPQDGRASVQVGDRGIDLRMATLPTTFGERIVIRLLDKGARLYTATELGMDDVTLARFRGLIAREHGLVLVTGPTGSGKTTTLYAALREIDCKKRNVLTLEDPVEYRLEGISQTQISEKKGMTFASGLRNVLRQDPDIIMVGEIRDRETAVMAIQSALTGHLVFSTLHTNDAASAVTRLLDLGIEPYLLASSLVGVLAQRLVRRVCPTCAVPSVQSPEQWHRLGFGEALAKLVQSRRHNFRAGRGCEGCRNSGHRGRVGVFELLGITDVIRQRIQERATAAEIKAEAIAAGSFTLRDDGVAKIAAGITTVDEVARVTTEDPV